MIDEDGLQVVKFGRVLCPNCDRVTAKDDMKYTQCPYAREMCVTEEDRDATHWEWMCGECYSNRVGDI